MKRTYKCFNLLLFLYLLLFSLFPNINLSAEEKLLFAVTLIRHGDRTPLHDIITDPYKWEIGKGELTPLGMNQERKLGSELRKRYVDELKLLTPNYVNSSIYALATDFNRTIQSAQSFLLGLYPPGFGPKLQNGIPALPAAYQPIPIRTLPARVDNFLLAYGVRTDKFNKMCEKYVFSTEFWKKENNKYKDKLESWSKIFGVKIDSINDLGKIGDNLNVRNRYGVPFPQGLSNDDAQTIINLAAWFMAQQYKPKVIGNFIGSEFLFKLKDEMERVLNGKQEYKFFLYSGHDTSILPVMSALGVPLDMNPPYASHIDFELYIDNGKHFVKVMFNGIPVIIQGKKEGRYTFDQFVKIVEDSKPAE
ncbi:MAG: histidine-type phosphatase [Candidatus Riflebacteria bacterium]|nr:histidine-type phosphatase [Candidatus Riflebacteria bacterium]